MGKFTMDTSQSDSAIDKTSQKEKALENQHVKLPLDTHEAESKLDALKEKAQGALSSLGGGFLAGGLAMGAEKSLEAFKGSLESQENLKIALRQTGAEGKALDDTFKATESTIAGLADKYAKSKGSVRELATEVASLGGLSGESAKKATEIGLAMEQNKLPTKALKALIVGAADPESAGMIDQVASKFHGLKEALAGANTPAEKMDVIYKAMGPTLAGMQEAADGPLGQMTKMEETGKQLEKAFGGLIFSALEPFIPLVTGIGNVLNSTLIPALKATSAFVSDNKTAVAILAGGIGIMALAMNAGAIGTTAFSVATKASAVASNIATVAQKLWNAAMSANPLGLIVGAVTLVVGGLVLLYNKVEPVRKAIDGLWSAVKTAVPFLGSLASMLGLSSDKAKESTTSLDENKKSTDAAAVAQKALTDAITGANDAYKKQATDASGTIDTNRVAFDRQLQYIKDGYAIVNGVRHDFTAQEIADYKASNAKLIEQARDRNSQLKAQAANTKEYNKEVGLDTQKKTAQDLLAIAKEAADTAAKKLEIETRLQRAKDGQSFTDRDQLAIEQKRSAVFNEQVETLKVMTEQKGKFAGKTTLEVQQNQIKELDLTAKIKIDDEKLKADLNKSIQSLTKKQIELGILPKGEGIKLIEAQIDELGQKAALLQGKLVLAPKDPKLLAELNQTNEQILGLEKEQSDIRKSLDDQLTNARIANIKNVTERAIQERNRQFEQDLQFVRDAYNADRELTKQEAALKLEIEKKYNADILQIRADANANQRKFLEEGLNFAVDALKEEFAARQKFDRLAYEDKKLQLDKQQATDNKAYRKGEVSAKEYALNLEKINGERAKNELAAIQSKWANEEAVVKKAQGVLSADFEKYALENAQAALAGAAGDEKAKEAHIGNAKGTLLGAIANLIAGQITIDPLLGGAIGLAAGLALNAGFSAIEKSMGFAKGGTWVGENGPELVAPKTDFSQMVSLLVSSTAQEVRRAMAADYGPVRSGSRSPVRVQVSGQFRNDGRAMVATLDNESVASRHERLIN